MCLWRNLTDNLEITSEKVGNSFFDILKFLGQTKVSGPYCLVLNFKLSGITIEVVKVAYFFVPTQDEAYSSVLY